MTNFIAPNDLFGRVSEFILSSPEHQTPAAFDALFVQLAQAQIGSSAFLSRFFEGAVGSQFARWQDAPLLPIAAFKGARVAFFGPAETSLRFLSSGTTAAERSAQEHTEETLAIYTASLLEWFRRRVEPRLLESSQGNYSVISLTPSRKLAPHSSLVFMLDEISKAWGLETSAFVGVTDTEGNWGVNAQALREWVQCNLTKKRPVLLVGTAFNFVQALDALAAEGELRLPAGSLVMETGGYKGRTRKLPKQELYAEIQKLFGVSQSRIVSEYGMCELSSQGYESEDAKGRRRFELPPWARFRVLSPETGAEAAEGETGILAIYDLANAGSYVALQTEDLAIRREKGFELIGRDSRRAPKGCSLFAAGS